MSLLFVTDDEMKLLRSGSRVSVKYQNHEPAMVAIADGTVSYGCIYFRLGAIHDTGWGIHMIVGSPSGTHDDISREPDDIENASVTLHVTPHKGSSSMQLKRLASVAEAWIHSTSRKVVKHTGLDELAMGELPTPEGVMWHQVWRDAYRQLVAAGTTVDDLDGIARLGKMPLSEYLKKHPYGHGHRRALTVTFSGVDGHAGVAEVGRESDQALHGHDISEVHFDWQMRTVDKGLICNHWGRKLAP